MDIKSLQKYYFTQNPMTEPSFGLKEKDAYVKLSEVYDLLNRDSLKEWMKSMLTEGEAYSFFSLWNTDRWDDPIDPRFCYMIDGTDDRITGEVPKSVVYESRLPERIPSFSGVLFAVNKDPLSEDMKRTTWEEFLES